MIRLNEKALFTLLLLTFCGMICYLTLDLGRLARLVPLRVVLPTMGFFGCQLLLDLVPRLAQKYKPFENAAVFRVESFRDRTDESQAHPVSEFSTRPGELSVFLWVLLMPALILLFGFVIAIPLYTFLYLKYRARESWHLALMLTTAMWLVVYGVFVLALGVHLYKGILWEWSGVFL